MTQTVVRTGDPLEIVALAEHTLGFRPRESLVLVGLRGPRRRAGLVVRVDLAAAGDPDLPRTLAEHLRADGATDAVLVVHTTEPAPPPDRDGRTRLDSLPHARQVAALRAQLHRRGLAPAQAWLASGGRLFSYTCTDPCCPPGGRAGDPTTTEVAAEMVLAGSAVDPDRSTWHERESASLRPASAAVRRQVEAAARRPLGAGGAGDVLAWWCDALATTTRAVRAGRPAVEVAGELLTPGTTGRALAALGDHHLRDAVLLTLVPGGSGAAEALARGGPQAATAFERVLGGASGPDGRPPAPEPDVLLAGQELLRALVRAASTPRRAEPLAVLAWASWWQGAGPQAALAAAAALQAEPGHRLAALVLRAVEAGVPPDWVRPAGSASAS